MRQRYLALALVAAVVPGADRASAWNSHGHMVVAKVAWSQLTDGQKLKIAAILKAHPHYKEFLLKGKPRGVAEEEWVFLKAATWPDWVRPKHGKETEISKKYHHGEWHFIDKPFVKPEDREQFDEKTLEPKGETILTALPRNIKGLTSGEDADKAVALCWVLHLIGDIHQPLHCASFYSETFPKGDRGGNSQLVKAGGRPIPLHPYWDALIGTSIRYRAIDVNATDISRDPKYRRDEFLAELKSKEFPDWAKESHEQAREIAYQDGKLKSQRIPRARDSEEEFSVPDLPEGYEAEAKDCARKRVALAGYRLADRLKEAFE
jgi:hypothetical protein